MRFDTWELGQDVDARKALVAGLDGPRTVAGWWHGLVQRHAVRTAIEHRGEALTYAALEERSAALARGLLAQGAGKGTRIGLLFPNGIDWVAGWLAIERIGAIAVTLSTFFAAGELRYAVRHGDVAILLSAGGYLRHDYRARMEEAFPELSSVRGDAPLMLADCPYLRSVWFDTADRPAWSHGTLDDLRAIGRASETASAAFLAAVEAVTSPADTALLMFTSGSTAEPKAVVHNQFTLVAQTTRMATMNTIIPAHTTVGDRTLLTMPFFWVGGFLSMAGGLMLGGTLLCEDDHGASNLLRAIREGKATQFSASAPLLASIAALPECRPEDIAGLKLQHVAQAPWFLRDWPHGGRELAASLGMTESCGPHSGEWIEQRLPEGLEGSQGRVVAGMEYRLVDPETGDILPEGATGELCIRGVGLMEGFYKKLRSDVFDSDGFYHTGDECRIGPDGHLFVHGRLGGMIKTAGANVSPEEVELALRSIDGVIEAGVFALAHPKRGETVTAVVVAHPGSGLTEAGLREALRALLSVFKIPRHILFMDRDAIPRTPSDKIRRPALAKLIAEQHPELLRSD